MRHDQEETTMTKEQQAALEAMAAFVLCFRTLRDLQPSVSDESKTHILGILVHLALQPAHSFLDLGTSLGLDFQSQIDDIRQSARRPSRD
jgi:hypothetical protein